MNATIDALLERLRECTPEERRAFVRRFGEAARAAGVTVADAEQAMRDLARSMQREPRALSCEGEPFASEACEHIAREPESWREGVVRRAARYSCAIEPFHFADLFCWIGFGFGARCRSDQCANRSL